MSNPNPPILQGAPDPKKIKAKISSTCDDGYKAAELPDGTPSSKYYYMFTGGYTYDAATNLPGAPAPSEDAGPAGEVKITPTSNTFTIDVDDKTGTRFQITQWNLGVDVNLSHMSFDPQPGTVLATPTRKLTVTATDTAASDLNRWDGYFVTLVNENNEVIKLDPRIYDMA